MRKPKPKKKPGLTTLHIATGKTPRGNTDWKKVPNDARAIYVHVDTSNANFKTTPNYVASLAGGDWHWLLTGTSAIYDASPTGFAIYLRWWDWGPNLPKLTREFANMCNWHVTWIGAEESASNNDT